MNRYTVTAYREGTKWYLQAARIRGATTHVDFLADAEDAMSAVLARLTGEDAGTIGIDLIALPGPGGFD